MIVDAVFARAGWTVKAELPNYAVGGGGVSVGVGFTVSTSWLQGHALVLVHVVFPAGHDCVYVSACLQRLVEGGMAIDTVECKSSTTVLIRFDRLGLAWLGLTRRNATHINDCE